MFFSAIVGSIQTRLHGISRLDSAPRLSAALPDGGEPRCRVMQIERAELAMETVGWSVAEGRRCRAALKSWTAALKSWTIEVQRDSGSKCSHAGLPIWGRFHAISRPRMTALGSAQLLWAYVVVKHQAIAPRRIRCAVGLRP